MWCVIFVLFMVLMVIFGVLSGSRFIVFMKVIYMKIDSVSGVIVWWLLWKVFFIWVLMNLMISLMNVCFLDGMFEVVLCVFS